MRDRRVARVIDREIAPIWHDRFARLIVRNLPNTSDVIALDIHCGVGRMTAELLARMGASARVLAIEPDDTLIDFARTKMRPEWKNRVYLKPGNFDDVTAMADDSYNLVVANLVLGDAGDIGSALAEMIRVNRIGGRILATLPLAGSWHEVEDIFAEVLRDAGLTDAVRRLERLRELRPSGPQLSQIVRGLGVAEDDFVIEQERFQLLFPSGREFLFAPVVEHGPLRLWKAVIGKDGSPQELFWRLKEAIDTYYTGHVLAVNVLAGLMNIHVAKGTESPGPRLAARYWRHYPGLDALWGGLAAGYVRVSEPSLPPFGDADFDFDLEIDEGESRRTGAQKPVTTSIPIVTDDLYDDAAAAALEPAAEPSRPAARQVAGAGRTSAEPARPMATLQPANTSARLKRPPVAEDDFSDINDSFEPSKSFRREDLRTSFSDTHDEPEPPSQVEGADESEEVEEPADPTSPFRLEELRAAAEPREHEEREEPAEELEDAEEVEDSGDPDDADEPDDTAEAPTDDEPEAQEEIAAEPAPVVEPVRPLSSSSGTFRSPLHDSNITRRPTGDASTGPTFRPPSESGTFRAPSSESSGVTPRFSGESSGATPRSALHDSGVRSSSESSGATPRSSLHDSGIRRPSSESSGVTPRPSSESSGATPRSSLHDSGIRRPSSESSGFTPRPSSESSGATPRSSLNDSGIRRPSSESSGATPRSSLNDSGIRRPSSESSGFTPRPSSESSGATPRSSLNDSGIRRPSSESSGVNPMLLRPAAAEPVTGSFKVFAPPKPRLSPETGPRDPDPYASDLSSLASEPVGDVPEIGPRTASRDAPAAPTRSPSRDAPAAPTRTASRDAPAAPARSPSRDAPAAPTRTPSRDAPIAEARTPSRDVPAAPPIAARPPISDTSPEDEDELDELDELDEAEELEEEDDAPPPTTRGGPPPPRPKAPPPPPSGLFKPRALLPIVAPPKKK